MFAGNYAPEGWLPCDGRLLSVQQNNVLFSLLGTTYGGDGVSTFAIPNLQCRVPIGAGQGPNLQPVAQGKTGGAESVELTEANIPVHTHLLNATSTVGNNPMPTGAMHAYSSPASTNTDPEYTVPPASPKFVQMNPGIVSYEGGIQTPVSVVQPYFTTSMIICVGGTYPS